MPQLLIVDPRGGEQRVRLERPEYTLGRDPSVSIPLQDVKVSRKHARIVHDGAAYWIEDLGSANGVMVGGRPITRPHKLSPGAEVDIGGFLIIFEGDRGAPTKSYSLIGLTAPYRGQAFVLPDGVLEVGRVDGCAIVIPDASVSRKHSTLTVSGTVAFVEDLDSSNGTFVNGVRVGRRQLEPGDRVRFGNVEFELSGAGGPGTPETGLMNRLANADRSIQIALAITLLSLLLLIVTIVVAVGRSRGSAPGRQDGQSLEAAYARAVEASMRAAQEQMAQGAWGEAAEAFQAVLDRDPINKDARVGLEAMQRNAADEKTLEAANEALQAGRVDDAMTLVRTISADAHYGPVAHELAQRARGKIAQSALVAAKRACEEKEWKTCHTHVLRMLDAKPDSIEGQAIVADAESNMRARRIPFTPWSVPAAGPTGSMSAGLDSLYSDADVRSAAAQYAAGDLEQAIRKARAFANRPGASRLTKFLVELKDAKTRADGAAMAGDIDRAVAGWEQALTADANLLPAGHPSVLGDQVRRRMGSELLKKGNAAFGRGVYAEAFHFWSLGLRHNSSDPDLLAGVTRLEKRAESTLGDMPAGEMLGADSCNQLREILAMTRPESAAHREALERESSHCRR